MHLMFQGDTTELHQGIELLSSDLGFGITEDGLCVTIVKRKGNIAVSRKNGSAIICYEQKVHFYRALCLLMEQIKSDKEFHIEQEPQFQSVCAMVDCSRGGVLKVESIKTLVRKIARMGYDSLMMNSSDTYTIDNYPYFGYMRGRYSFNELKECDDYADIFGIEVIPCIQTLAHLTEALQWDYATPLKDTEDVLLVGSEKTYDFIEKMIASVSAPFRSKRIHIGMDEAFDLGRGKYLDINGVTDKLQIMMEHLTRTTEICDKYELKPMIWSDMLFKYFSKSGDYYDLESVLSKEDLDKIPKQVQLVFWDYHHTKENDYAIMLKKHKECRNDIVFAGGICTWHGLAVNYGLSFATTNAALPVCKKAGIKEVIATVWGDNGTESNYLSSVLGLQLFAEHAYLEKINTSDFRRRFETCTNASFDAFMDLQYFDVVPGVNPEITGSYSNPHKYLLWQDILLGLFDKNTEGLNLNAHYKKLAHKMECYKNENEEWSYFFDVMVKLATVLSIKSEIGTGIKRNYDEKNIEILRRYAKNELPELRRCVKRLRDAHRVQWLKIYKPFGWEILDIRYGGLLSRIDTAILRIEEYTNGAIDTIEELEQERLPFGNEKEGLCFCNQYSRIVSASPL